MQQYQERKKDIIHNRTKLLLPGKEQKETENDTGRRPEIQGPCTNKGHCQKNVMHVQPPTHDQKLRTRGPTTGTFSPHPSMDKHPHNSSKHSKQQTPNHQHAI